MNPSERGIVYIDMEEPDPAVIQAAAEGNTAAFEDLMRAYEEPVWRYLCRYLGDPDQARDVCQDTFLRVHRKLHTYTYRSKFSTWLFTVARNAAVDSHRRSARRERVLEVAPPSPPIGLPGLGLEIERALADLSDKLRESVLLIEVLGLTYREASQVLGVPEGTAKSRVFAARAQLAEWMRADEQTDATGEPG
ncbi:MAG: RNA polymerase sigma factor [Acidimicrobiia bacterium]|nr:RNA polymerase sigma factor [Acidimicrobiia bacterium]